ncbi:MAG TPA: NAD-dependent epimerase/dehydratase family protein, partial [Steroidobacteraceae bacterium]
MAESAGRIALVAGGSGLVGGQLLPLLLQSPQYTRVHALSRRPLLFDHPRLANRVVRFEASLQAQLKGLQCQDAFCCLGTTIREAGSQTAFRAVDLDLVQEFAQLALSCGAERLVVVSALGANPASKNFYMRVKGEMEKALEARRFRSLDILQPSLLLGSRRDVRLLELGGQLAMQLVNPLLLGGWSRFRAIPAATVAAAMCGAARS